METAKNDVLNVLMIGNSYCYYYVEELYELAKAAGIQMRVCNVYGDGCSLEKHYTWWKSGQSNYQYFETFGPRKTKTDSVGLEWCLAQHNWDVISLQLGGNMMRKHTADQVLDLTREHRAQLYGYLKKRFPNAKHYFQQTWTYEIGHTKQDGFVMQDLAQQIAHTENVRQMGIGICRENQVDCINTGDAWEIYRAFCEHNGISHNLCARLGKAKGDDPHGGDGTHDGDIGGGQYLNACVWFEILTGLDCRGNSYVPRYTYEGKEYGLIKGVNVSDLQNAAHQAVVQLQSRSLM
ncbi:MAG: DUF4886 domain-containing protein [Oscillospiraceae bacterium]|nr:DUF4886 domain-containing protein [Oscillospiraceae bacterium]